MPALSTPIYPPVEDIRRARPSDFKQRIEDGLLSPSKSLPQLLLWDAMGLVLFDKFAARSTYHPARKEMELVQDHAEDIVRTIPPGSIVIELGSGHYKKTALILTALESHAIPFAYYALDFNRTELQRNLNALSRLLHSPTSIIAGLQGTYDDLGPWLSSAPQPAQLEQTTNITFLWLGNSIANSTRAEAAATMAALNASLPHSLPKTVQWIIAADGCVDEAQLIRAYDPRSAALHAFIFHALHSANEILGRQAFRAEDWSLDVRFDAKQSVLEVGYRAKRDLEVAIDDRERAAETRVIPIRKGDKMGVIPSGKWRSRIMGQVGAKAGMSLVGVMGSEKRDYGLYFLRPRDRDDRG